MQLLNKKQVGELFGTSSNVAIAILKSYGINHIDLGIGRGRGYKWLKSAVEQVIFDLHEKAQAKNLQNTSNSNRKQKTLSQQKCLSIHEMSLSQIQKLLTSNPNCATLNVDALGTRRS